MADGSLQRVFDRATRDRQVTGAAVRMESADRRLAWSNDYGDLAGDRPFFIASTTKLFTTAIVLRLIERGRLGMETRLVDVLDSATTRGLHVRGDVERTKEIMVRHLLANTSGLPDYFSGRRSGGGSLEKRVKRGQDQAWTLDDIVEAVRRMPAAFPPGKPGKALYSDTNFQLLGAVIGLAACSTYSEALHREVIAPLQLADTWLYADPSDARPAALRFGERKLDIPRAMTSFGPDGGIVSTSGDLMVFLRGFFEGRLFDVAMLPDLQQYNRIFFPLQYGVGHARLAMPRVFSPFAPQPELIGHSGLSGAFAFLAPASGTFLTGTVNNVAKPGRSFRLMLRLLAAHRM